MGGGARNQGVGTSRGHHDARKVTGVLDQLTGVTLQVGVAVALDGFELFGEAGELVASLGLDDADTFEANIKAGGRDLNALAVADEDRYAELFGDELASGLDDARVGAFGEDDPLRVVLETGGKAGN